MRIVIDLQGAQTESRFRGIGRYTLSLATAIVRNRGEHEVIIALSGLFPDTIEYIRSVFEGLLPQENIRVWYAPGPTFEADSRNALACRVAELLRESFLKSLNPDLVLVSSLFEGLGDNAVTSIGLLNQRMLTVVILYDLIPLLSPDDNFRNNPIHKGFYSRKIKSLQRSNCLLAISESARQEALQALDFDKNDVINIKGACDSSFRIINLTSEDRESLNNRIGISRPFVMYTGGADDRKNLNKLIEAYSLMPDLVRREFQLVLVGRMPESVVDSLKLTANSSGLGIDEIVFTGYVDDADLVALYNACKVFIFPSLHEGFGLPPLEAMACGAPTIVADATSLPEVVGFSEALFDPKSLNSISSKLLQALTDSDFCKRLVSHGQHQAKQFSWDESAQIALTKMQEIACRSTQLLEEVARTEDVNAGLIEVLADLHLRSRLEVDLVSVSQCIAENGVRLGLPQLILDVSTIVHSDAKSGIQRVVRSLLCELIEQPPEGFIVRPVFLDGGRYRYAQQFLSKKMGEPKTALNEFASFWAGDVYLSLDLNMHLVPEMHTLHSKMRRSGVSMNYIVYDLLLATNPEWWNSPNPQLFLDWLKLICEVGDKLICISSAVATELKVWMERNPIPRVRSSPLVRSFHLGADIENSKPSRGLPDDFQLVFHRLQQAPGFLMVGTLEPRKGHAQALSAFEILWSEGIEVNLVIVGAKGWLVDDLTRKISVHPEISKHLFWLEGISDEYLERIYDSCTCLIAPSEGEGFGLPLIEAAKHKLPIIARDIPVFREVAGEHAYYFSGLDPHALVDAVKYWQILNDEGKAPQSIGMHYLTWRLSAEQLLSQVLPSRQTIISTAAKFVN